MGNAKNKLMQVVADHLIETEGKVNRKELNEALEQTVHTLSENKTINTSPLETKFKRFLKGCWVC